MIDKAAKKAYDAKRYKEQRLQIIERTAAWGKKNKEKRCSIVKAWRARNPDKAAAQWSAQRANRLKRAPNWLTKEQKNHIAVFYDAAQKLSKELNRPIQVDHIIPLQGKTVCGLHVPWNLQLLFAEENLSKKNKLCA